MPSFLQQSNSGNSQRTSSRNAFKSLLIGLVWVLLQFGSSELLHRLSLSASEDESAETLSQISDLVSWPAIVFYQKAEAQLYRDALEGIIHSLNTSDLIVIEKSQELLDDFERSHDEEAFVTDSWEWLEQNGIDVYISTSLEYQIYFGTCVIWGTVIAILSYIYLSLFSNNKNVVISQLHR